MPLNYLTRFLKYPRSDANVLKERLNRLALRSRPERMTEITEKLSNNGLFIVGHARSGTSILQTALDLCPDIFLLNEANLHCHHYKENFVVWYRGMHANLGNPLSKLNSCPIPDDVAGDGFDVVLTARRTHKYVGDKLAFRNRALNGTY